MSIAKTREFLYWLKRLLGDGRLIRQTNPALWWQNQFNLPDKNDGAP